MTLRHAQGHPEQRRGVRVFGIDPGSVRTGYACVETDGRRHRLIACGAITVLAGGAFPDRLERIHRELTSLLASCRPECVAIENVFHAKNARSALKLGHARGVAMLAAAQAGCLVVEYTPAEVKRAVVGHGRAEKAQVQQMVKLLLGLEKAPTPLDASDALAVAICHLHQMPLAGRLKAAPTKRDVAAPTKTDVAAPTKRDVAVPIKRDVGAGCSRPDGVVPKSWRHYRPPTAG